MAQQYKIGFLGFGNMAQAILSGMLEHRLCDAQALCVYDTDQSKISAGALQYGFNTASSMCELEAFADIIFLCVKPNVLRQIIGEWQGSKKAFVSIAAGIPFEFLSSALGEDARILRVMPNTPLMVKKGAVCMQAPTDLTKQEFAFIKMVFEQLGLAVTVDAELMDCVTGISGSGPAYVYYFIRAMVQAGIEHGLTEETAKALALQTVDGAVEMIRKSSKSITDLISDVCSPGGTTLEAIQVFDERGMDQTIKDGITACIKKSVLLSK